VGPCPVPQPPRLLRIKTFFHENLLEPQGRCWNLFTPWHKDDLNSCLKGDPAFELLRRAVGDDLAPVWPERWPRARLQARCQEIGEVAFARGCRLVCVPDGENTGVREKTKVSGENKGKTKVSGSGTFSRLKRFLTPLFFPSLFSWSLGAAKAAWRLTPVSLPVSHRFPASRGLLNSIQREDWKIIVGTCINHEST
jgi:hypothetical protein